MSYLEQKQRQKIELKAAIGDLIAEWAGLEQRIIHRARSLAQTNELFHELYGTVLQKIPFSSAINEDVSFSKNLRTLKKVAREALPHASDAIAAIEKEMRELSKIRNDIAHRLEIIAPPWATVAQIECRQRPPRDIYETLSHERHLPIVYTIEDLHSAALRIQAVNGELMELFDQHIDHVLKVNNLSVADIKSGSARKHKTAD